MTKTNKKPVKSITVNTNDPNAVAGYLSEYLKNNPKQNRDEFCQVMQSFPHHAHNFLVLALHWFNRLGKTMACPHNEASVEMAKAITEKMGLGPDFDLWDLVRPGRKFDSAEVLEAPIEIDAANVMAYYLSHHNGTHAVYEKFVVAFLSDHPTIQQSFTRLIVDWCRWLDKGDTAKGKTLEIARMILSCARPLPYL